MNKTGLFLIPALLGFVSVSAFAQSGEPGLFGVKEVVVNPTRFDDPKASNVCGLSQEAIASVLSPTLAAGGVPVLAASEARPALNTTARVSLYPTVSSYEDSSLGCASWLTLSVESREAVTIVPIMVPRLITAVYWRQNAKVTSGQSLHVQKVGDVVKAMAEQFAQQYKLDQGRH